jgi:pimeloyl-ACP methyl ester carboxylesterase
MLTAETVPAEGARYAASVVLVPGLWAPSGAWRAVATYLAHRGWDCHLPDLRAVAGGLAARAAALSELTATLPSRAVLVGHDGGALAALGAARQAPAASLVLVAPLVPGSREARTLVRRLRSLWALVGGGRVPPPDGDAAALLCGELPAPTRAQVLAALGSDDAAAVRDVVWGRVALAPAPVPTLLVSGARDPLLPPPAAATLAATLGAEHRTLEQAGHWPLAGAAWQPTVDLVHRWLVQRLGEPLLELYPEAMVERGDQGEDE